MNSPRGCGELCFFHKSRCLLVRIPIGRTVQQGEQNEQDLQECLVREDGHLCGRIGNCERAKGGWDERRSGGVDCCGVVGGRILRVAGRVCRCICRLWQCIDCCSHSDGPDNQLQHGLYHRQRRAFHGRLFRGAGNQFGRQHVDHMDHCQQRDDAKFERHRLHTGAVDRTVCTGKHHPEWQ